MNHILVVDDSPVIRRYSRLIFESIGFRVSEAETGAEALERARAEQPDYILVDWLLGTTPAHDLIARLRRQPAEKRPFIIYLPTENDVADVTKAFKAGADEYLLKPFNREIVQMKLHEIQVAA